MKTSQFSNEVISSTKVSLAQVRALKQIRKLHFDYARENYYALALSVCEKMPSGKALYLMGVAPATEKPVVINPESPYRQIGRMAYILTKVCGVMQKDVAKAINVSKTTLRKALAHYQEEVHRVA